VDGALKDLAYELSPGDQVEGVLIAPVGDSSKPHLRLLTRNGVRFVLIDRSIAGFDGDLVQGDSLAGARQLVEHLIELGHRRIGMITEGLEVSTARLIEGGEASASEIEAIRSEADAAVEAAIERARTLPAPDLEEAYADVFGS